MSNDNMSTYTLDNAAVELLDAGFSVIPIRDVASKRPDLGSWKPFQTDPASADTARHWFTANGRPAAPGMAVVCGEVSGHLEVLDFDNKPDGILWFEHFAVLVNRAVPGLLGRLPRVRTQSGGIHLYTRSTACKGNTVLARDGAGHSKIETRGEGGYVLAPPTRGYTQEHKDIRDTGHITLEERTVLFSCAMYLDESDERERASVGSKYETSWDQYNHEQGADKVLALLVRHGWQVVKHHGGMVSLRRPNKDKGTSATLFTDGEIPLFYNFSTNAPSIPAGKGLSPFALLAHLEHDGDFSRTARKLFKEQGRAKSATAPYLTPVPTPAPGGDESAWVAAWVTHAELRGRTFPERRWAVPNLIPDGCTLLCGGPKVGKSWLLLDLAICVEFGSKFLKFETCVQGEVAYIQLEDGEQLVAERLLKLAAQGSDRLRFEFHWPSLDRGGLEALDAFLLANPAVRLVMIDTLARVRPASQPAKGMYEMDYAALKGLTDLSHARSVSIIVAHHTRKMASKDTMDLVSGSNGLGGAVDTVMVLERKRLEDVGVLTIMSRLIEEHAYACRFDKEGPRWEIVGDADQVAETESQQEILDCLRDAGKPLSPAQIAEAIGHKNPKSVRNILSRMEAGHKVVRVEWGKYKLSEEEAAANCHVATIATHATQDDPGDPPCSHALNIESGTRGTRGNVATCTTGNEGSTLSERDMLIPCPGCDKQYQWRGAPENPAHIICRTCGTSFVK